MMTKNPLRFALLGSAAMLALVPAAGFAQTAPSADASPQADSADIIVTAQRRGESVQEVPISISAFTQKTLDAQGIKDIQDVVKLTPGLSFSRGGQQGLTNISIRGIRSNGGASTTGIYLDDVPIQSRRAGFAGGSPFPRIFDLDRVEVLRGPQGTLFGAGSEGGTVRFITPQPSLSDTSMYGRAELSSTEYGGLNYEAGLAVGAPIVTDKIGFRASGWYRRESGWVDRVDPVSGALLDENSNSSTAVAARAALTFAPSETVRITPAFFYQREHSNDPAAYWTILSNPDKNIYRSGNRLAAPTNDRFWIPSLNVDADLSDAVKIVSVTSYLDRDQMIHADYTGLVYALVLGNPITKPGSAAANSFHNTQQSFTQEVRLQSSNSAARLQWVAGVFYQRSQQNSTQLTQDPTIASTFQSTVGIPFAAAFGQNPIDGRILYDQSPFKTVDTQIASFGQLDFKVTPALTLTAGLRVARTKFSVDAGVRGPFAGVAFRDSGSQSETPVTPKIGLDYRLSPDNNLYASVSKGYRVGGYNPRQYSICQPQLASLGLAGINPTKYDSDHVWSYEVGSKNQFLNRSVTLNASLYYIDWSNIQQFVTLNSCGGGFIANLGNARSKGFDLQASVRPAQGLTLGATVGYTDSTFKNTVYVAAPIPGTSAVSAGDHVQGAPWRVSANVEYRRAIGGDREIYGRMDYQYQSREPRNVPQTNVANGLNYISIYYGAPQYNLFSFRVGASNRTLDASLFVDNAFNSKAILDGQNYVGSILTYASSFRPRTIGATVTLRR